MGVDWRVDGLTGWGSGRVGSQVGEAQRPCLGAAWGVEAGDGSQSAALGTRQRGALAFIRPARGRCEARSPTTEVWVVSRGAVARRGRTRWRDGRDVVSKA